MRTIIWILALVTCSACRADNADNADSTALARADTGAAPRAGGIGIQFDPWSIKINDTVGTMRVTAVDVQRAVAMPDSPYVGTVHFRGAVELDGGLMHYPDQADKAVCFEANPATAALLPRMRGDTRRPWFCFDNYAYAAERTARFNAADEIRVQIDNFVVNYAFSDVYNTAQLLKVEKTGKGHAR